LNEQQVWFSLSHPIKKVRREESIPTGLWTCIRLHLVITAIADKPLHGVRTAYPIRCLTRPTQTRQYIAVFHLKTFIHCLLKYYLWGNEQSTISMENHNPTSQHSIKGNQINTTASLINSQRLSHLQKATKSTPTASLINSHQFYILHELFSLL